MFSAPRYDISFDRVMFSPYLTITLPYYTDYTLVYVQRPHRISPFLANKTQNDWDGLQQDTARTPDGLNAEMKVPLPVRRVAEILSTETFHKQSK